MVKKQMIRLTNSGGKVVETKEEINEELNDKFQSVLTVVDPLSLTPMKWEEETMQNISIVRKVIDNTFKDLDPGKVHGTDEISPCVLKESKAT